MDTVHFLGVPFLIWVFSRMHVFDTAYDLIIINVIALTASSLVGLFLSKSLFQLKFIPDFTIVKKTWDYGKWAGGSTISGLAVSKADTFILAAFAGPIQVAVYGSVKVFVRVYEMLTQIIQMFVMPAASRLSSKGDFRSLKAMVEKATMFSTLGMIPILIAFVVFPAFLVTFLYQGKYLDAIPILRIFGLAALAIPLSAVAGNVLMGLGHARTVFVVGFQMFLVALVGYLTFIPRLGGTGAAMGYVITCYASALIALWYLKKHVPLSIGEVLKRANDILVFVRTRLRS